MLDRPGAPLADALRETTERWIDAFNAALAGRSAAGLSALFVADSHWRNLFGISWHFATFSGNATVVAELLARGAEVRAGEFPDRHGRAGAAQRRGRRPRRRRGDLPLRHGQWPGLSARSGCCASRTALAKAWTISTSLDFDAICDGARERLAAESAHPRFRRPDWLEQRQAERAYDDRDPDVLIVGGGHAGISAAVELKRIGLTRWSSTARSASATTGGCAIAA